MNYLKLVKRFFIVFVVASGVFIPTYAVTKAPAKQAFDIAVWIPYWRKTDGASTTLANLDTITQISPFAYELQTDGTIKDAMKYNEEPWTTLVAEAKKKGVKVYPSILSYPHNDKEKYLQYMLLAKRTSRKAHVAEIVALVKKNKFDGIDIDYEAKQAEIKPYFSDFLTELSAKLHANGKKLICTIEPRTPPESRYATTSLAVLSKVEYANDYKVIGKVCDQVRIMTYDQIGDDASLNQLNASSVYRPVSDIDWVEKVLTLALRDIPAKKIIVGVPTYGYKYEVIPPVGTGSVKYSRIGSMNFKYADELAKMLAITPTRNQAGELSFLYATSTDIYGAYVGGMKQYLVWYSDAVAIADKTRIAKLYKLGGIAIFKIDGAQDPQLFQKLK
jgi:spore germination protein YaaH